MNIKKSIKNDAAAFAFVLFQVAPKLSLSLKVN